MVVQGTRKGAREPIMVQIWKLLMAGKSSTVGKGNLSVKGKYAWRPREKTGCRENAAG